MAIVYRHIRKDTNEVFYVGIGLEEKRAYTKDSRNRHWKNIINKTEYIVEITHRDIIWEEACAIERYLIAFYGRKDLGLGSLVNMTDGGDGILGLKHTNETKKKISLDNLRPEKLKVCMENLKKAQTPEAAKKRYANIDYSFCKNPEVIAKRKANTDYKAIAAKIDYKSSYAKGIGKCDRKANGIKIAKALKIPILQFNIGGKFIKEWPSAKDVKFELNIDATDIGRVCKGTRSSAGGFIWKYKNK